MSPVIMYALAAMVLFGLVDFFIKKGIGLGIEGNALLFYSMLVSAIPFGLLSIIEIVPLRPVNQLLFYTIIIGILMFLGTVALLEALNRGDATIVVPISRLGFVITASCAIIFLNENLTLTKGIGIICAGIAIILLSRK